MFASPHSPSPAALGGVSDPANWVLAGLDHLGMGLGTKNPFMAMPEQFKQDVCAIALRISGCSITHLGRGGLCGGARQDPRAGWRGDRLVPGIGGMAA